MYAAYGERDHRRNLTSDCGAPLACRLPPVTRTDFSGRPAYQRTPQHILEASFLVFLGSAVLLAGCKQCTHVWRHLPSCQYCQVQVSWVQPCILAGFEVLVDRQALKRNTAVSCRGWFPPFSQPKLQCKQVRYVRVSLDSIWLDICLCKGRACDCKPKPYNRTWLLQHEGEAAGCRPAQHGGPRCLACTLV